MSAFEFFFTFYGLLLGLALSNVAVGFGKLWRLQARVKIGWLTPLVAVCLVEMVSSLWLGAWHSVNSPPPINSVVLLAALGTTLPMIFASVVLFPDDAEPGGALDDHYMAHRRALVGALAITSSVGITAPFALGLIPQDEAMSYILMVTPMVLIPLVLVFVSRRRVHLAGLVALALYRGGLLVFG